MSRILMSILLDEKVPRLSKVELLTSRSHVSNKGRSKPISLLAFRALTNGLYRIPLYHHLSRGLIVASQRSQDDVFAGFMVQAIMQALAPKIT